MPVCDGGGGQGDVHHHGLRAHAHPPAQRPGPRPAHRAHRGGRGAHLRHGQSVQASRHLFQRRPALRAEDIGSILSYREATDGQILEEGISEASAISSWVAAATSYSVHGLRMLPFYIYYSMFGFQRVGDLIWAAADQRARGFLLGATAGRTTLGGEGLQHQDGSSHLCAATVPNCRAYDPAFAGEFAVILDHGMRQMLEQEVDAFYYVTLMNENYPQPSLPEGWKRRSSKVCTACRARLTPRCACSVRGTLVREAQAAAQLLADDWQVASEVYSVTSFSELAREAREVERWNRLHPQATPARQSCE
jgi:pyruvate dehydrogenase E1 component